ncbi:MAG: hypothetical protein D6791_00225 [Chloroflexi bacterium]|nr:MAG: hypothetical protein D6791_00225 [Chloroflexota bacterium]
MPALPPPITLRQINADLLPDLQALYERSTGYFLRYGGAPARPEQAALDYQHVLESGNRVLLGIWWEGEMMVGCIDMRLDHPAAGVAWLGAVILQDELPGPRTDIETWALRILEEWLRIATPVSEIRLAVLVSDRQRVRFWHSQGYTATPESLRQWVGERQERLVIYRKTLIPSTT